MCEILNSEFKATRSVMTLSFDVKAGVHVKAVLTSLNTLLSRIERKYCLISTSY